MPVLCVRGEPSRKIEEKKGGWLFSYYPTPPTMFPGIADYRESVEESRSPLLACSLSRLPRPSMHMFFFFPPFIPTWLHTTLDHFEITGEDDYTGAAPSLSTIFPFPCREGELGLVETQTRRGASLLSRNFPGYHFPIIHNSIIRSWLIDLIGRRDLKRALYIAAC